MRLHASCEINLKTKQATPLIAMLRPRSGYGQWLASEAYQLEPFAPVVEYVDGYGNLCQRLVAPRGKFKIRVDAQVETADTIDTKSGAPLTAVEELPDAALQFLLPSRYIPSDELGKQAFEIVAGVRPGYDQVETIRTWTHDNIEYRYGVSKPTTTARETLRDRAGVCRDFSHVGIALCRSLRIPARMVVGYLHQLDPMDMHAWFEAFVDGRWFTFDATQPKPRGGRITIAYGRDAADVALFTEYGDVELTEMKVTVDKSE